MPRTNLATSPTTQREDTGARRVNLSGQRRPVAPEPGRPGEHQPLTEEEGPGSVIARSLLYLLVGGALVLFALWAINPVPCSDLWWQLKTGEIIWNEHAIPRTDRFSFMAAGRPWIIQEWATEVLFYLLFVKLSPEAMVLFKMLTFAGAMGLGLAAAWTRCRSGLIAIVTALIIGYAAHFYADMRPQMMSYLFLTALLLILERDRANPRSRARWLLPPLMLVWVNCHAAFMAGVSVLLATLVGSLIEVWLRNRAMAMPPLSDLSGHQVIRSSSPQAFRRLLPPVALALMATCLNPYGASIYVYPFTLLSHSSMLNFVQEWFSPDFHLGFLKPYELCLFLVPAALLVNRRPKRAADLLLLLFWAHQSLQSRRHIPIFLLVSLPILAEQWTGAGEQLWPWLRPQEREAGAVPENVLLDKTRSRRSGSSKAAAAGAVILMLLIGLGIAHEAQGLPRTRLFEYSAELSFFPRDACDFIERHGRSGRLYNEFDWGGYCIWRFYPRQQVFIDGRCEVYFDGAWEDHQAVHFAQADWEARLRDARIDTLLISPDSYLNRVLPTSHEWVRVYADPMALVFRRQQPFEP